MEQELYEEKEHRGYTCKVFYDSCAESPAYNRDMFGTMFNQGRYYFENRKIEEILEPDEDGGYFVNPDYIYVRVYIYDHSGITIWSSREPEKTGWDSGLLGFYAVEKTKAEKEFGDLSDPDNMEKVLKLLEAEVEEWDTYCRGDIYGFEVFDEDDCLIDSCWGFYGDPDKVMAEAISIANDEADYKERQEREKAERVRLYEMVCEPFWID